MIKTLLSLGALLVLAACSNATAPAQDTTITTGITQAEVLAQAQVADAEILAQGEAIYLQSCAACHGINGEGQFPNAPMQPDDTGRIGAPPHDSTGHTWHHDDDMLYRVVREGGMGSPQSFYPMPAFGEQLSDTQIEAVIAYIKTMWSAEERVIQAQRTLLTRQQNSD